MSNHVLFVAGRATKDAELLKSKADKSFAKFSVAVNDFNSQTKESTPYYYDVLVFGKSAETVESKVKKGDMVVVQGKPQVEAYVSKKTKEAKATITIVADIWNVVK